METINGVPIETIYLYSLIIAGALTLLYVLFSDLLSGLLDSFDFLNPVLLFSFITFLSAGGFILEKVTALSSLVILLISAGISAILVTLLNVFVLVPLSQAEASLSYNDSDLRGRIGKVITSIPVNGYGEVMIDSISGRIAKPASSYDGTEIGSGKDVLVVDTANGVLQVAVKEKLEQEWI
ncbi:hypothetical protein DRW41_08060 [Neobacillus piezotolerans]|uniref:Membrane protein NfeD2 N-terminal transmembrane domain-containing protein n=1 Tax=Neobacillus piezotolerans TaxID=2259171 RepID=A0A3D8GTI9_9BACI|nr:hypothetical protein [Neobacillus piezotolerans]RDU37768.1 hypothetical protein DRW41_08060 [Neobacillus piezotolerans]